MILLNDNEILFKDIKGFLFLIFVILNFLITDIILNYSLSKLFDYYYTYISLSL